MSWLQPDIELVVFVDGDTGSARNQEMRYFCMGAGVAHHPESPLRLQALYMVPKVADIGLVNPMAAFAT